MSGFDLLQKSSDKGIVNSPILWPNSNGRKKKSKRKKPKENREPNKMSLKFSSCTKINTKVQRKEQKLKRRSSVEVFARVYNELLEDGSETDDVVPNTPSPRKLAILENSDLNAKNPMLTPFNRSLGSKEAASNSRRLSSCNRVLVYASSDSLTDTPTNNMGRKSIFGANWGSKNRVSYAPEVIEIPDSEDEGKLVSTGDETTFDRTKTKISKENEAVNIIRRRTAGRIILSSSSDEDEPLPLSERIHSDKKRIDRKDISDESDDDFGKFLDQMKVPRRKPTVIDSDSDGEKSLQNDSSSDEAISNTPRPLLTNSDRKTKRRTPQACPKTVPRMTCSRKEQIRSPVISFPSKGFLDASDANFFLTSLNCVSERRHPLAETFNSQFKKKKEDLTQILFTLFNSSVFDNKLPAKMKITWNPRMTKTAGYCYYRREPSAPDGRSARIELSLKVLDSADRLRDTLIHEMCHSASWIVYGYRDGHGPLWKYWARKANSEFPSLPVITRCHTYVINTKFTYKCQGCAGCIGRHTKSLDISRKVCSRCGGRFKLLINGRAASEITPRTITPFARFVKENYGKVKGGNKALKHAEVMKTLSADFAAKAVVKS